MKNISKYGLAAGLVTVVTAGCSIPSGQYGGFNNGFNGPSQPQGVAQPAGGGMAQSQDAMDSTSVCSQIFMSEIRLQCLQGSTNRVYTPAELDACKALMLNEQKRDCILSSGLLRQADAVAVAPPQIAPPQIVADVAAQPPAVALRIIKLQNFNATPITRVVWRPVKEIRFRGTALRRPLENRTTVDIEVGLGNIDFCFEFADGTRVFSTNMDDTFSFYLVPSQETRQKPGTCDDTL